MSTYAQYQELKAEVRAYFDGDNPCWEGYEFVGFKKKGGKRVPNCVPKKKQKLDAKKVLPKIGGKRPGKKCGKSYIAADRRCKGHYSESGKLTEEGKASAQELAGKVRSRKGMQTKARSVDNEHIFNNLAQAGKVYTQHGKNRVYFDVPDLLDMSKNQARRLAHTKFYFDLDEGFGHRNLSDEHFESAKKVLSWASNPNRKPSKKSV